MDNNTPTMEVSGLDQVIGSSFDSSFTSTNLTDEPKAEEPVQDEPAQQAEPTVTSEQGTENKAEVEDSFTATPYDELPDEIKPLHKSLQADYTRKRQLERQKMKDLEAKLKELESKVQNPNQTTDNEVSEGDPDTYISEEDRIRNYIKLERESEWDKQAVRDIETFDNRLNENHPEYDPYFDDLAREILERSLNEHIEKEGTKIGFDYKAKLQEFSNSWDGYIDKRIKTYINKQNEMIKKNAEATKKSSPEIKSAPVERSGKMSIHEAAMAAFEK